jgi:hypothetical protein
MGIIFRKGEDSDMIRCTRCLLPDTYHGITFVDGTCNFCMNFKIPDPLPERKLLSIFSRAKEKRRIYDALVPLSGGKDSTYVLYLAVKKYGLKVLAYTFDNGLFNEIALRNIDSAIKILNVDHIFIKPGWGLLKRLYRGSLLQSGELCTVCGIGITLNKFKICENYNIPLILEGDSYMESNSSTPENIYGINRFKTILRDSKDVEDRDIKTFLIYPSLTSNRRLIYMLFGKIGVSVAPLIYLPKISEEKISSILSKELNWKEGVSGKQQKHFDCIAEPFTNYIREYRYGFSRRVCQFSNLIRLGEMTRDEGLMKLEEEKAGQEPDNINIILERLELSRDELKHSMEVPPYKYAGFAEKDITQTRILSPVKKLAKNILLR